MNFKVIINNRNRLSTTKKLVEDLLNRNTNNIWIIDNNSSYPPLLEWYDNISKDINIIKAHNAGHLALFSLGVIDKIEEEWCFYTDSDIELNEKIKTIFDHFKDKLPQGRIDQIFNKAVEGANNWR
jgi:glycosyltransferase involved in cell wall biosynthesis